MADEIKAAGIEKFDGTDFGYWKMQFEDYLYGKKLHLPLLGSKPENMQEEDWLLLDRQDPNQDTEVKASSDPESRLNVGIVANLVIS